ncbi:hypothetical protein HDV57DRAFT_347627 [Trichoderma longibrachiatum]
MRIDPSLGLLVGWLIGLLHRFPPSYGLVILFLPPPLTSAPHFPSLHFSFEKGQPLLQAVARLFMDYSTRTGRSRTLSPVRR